MKLDVLGVCRFRRLTLVRCPAPQEGLLEKLQHVFASLLLSQVWLHRHRCLSLIQKDATAVDVQNQIHCVKLVTHS